MKSFKLFRLFAITVTLAGQQNIYAQNKTKDVKKVRHFNELKKISYSGKKSAKTGRALVSMPVINIPQPPTVSPAPPAPSTLSASPTTTPDDFLYILLPRTQDALPHQMSQVAVNSMITRGLIKPDGSVDVVATHGTITAISKQLAAQYMTAQAATANAPTPQVVAPPNNPTPVGTGTNSAPQPVKVVLPPPIIHQAPNQNQVVDSDVPKHPVPGTEHQILYFGPHNGSYDKNEREVIEKKEIQEMAKQNLIGVDGMLTGKALKMGYHSTIISSTPLKDFKSEQELMNHLDSKGKK